MDKPLVISPKRMLLCQLMRQSLFSRAWEGQVGAVVWEISKEWTLEFQRSLFHIRHLQVDVVGEGFCSPPASKLQLSLQFLLLDLDKPRILFAIIYLRCEVIHFRLKSNCFKQSWCFLLVSFQPAFSLKYHRISSKPVSSGENKAAHAHFMLFMCSQSIDSGASRAVLQLEERTK